MYDTIKCKKKLPLTAELKALDVKWDELNFQTKDLDNCLCDYTITKRGDLLEELVKYEYTYYTKEEQEKQKYPWRVIKDQKIIEQETKKVDFHGKITFYETLDLNDQESMWVDFTAYFIYGKLDKIELSKVEKYENRKTKMDEFWKKHEAEQNSIKYKIKKYSGWLWFWKKVGIICYKISSFFASINHFIIRNIR